MKHPFTLFRTLLLLSFFMLIYPIQAREVVSFNADWQFLKGPFADDPLLAQQKLAGKWSDVTLPHTWNAGDMQLEARNFYEGVCYYRKSFLAPESLDEKRLFLKFEGVGSVAHLYINGALIATHKGGYSAFSCEIGKALKAGEENLIVLKADNTARPDVIPVNHSLFGIYGGIYRPVWLITTSDVAITPTDFASSGIYISQEEVSAKSATIRVTAKLDNGSMKTRHIHLKTTLYDQSNRKVADHTEPVSLSPSGITAHTHQLTLRKPHLWQGIQSPYLYRLESEVIEHNEVVDRVAQPLGVRRIELIAGKGLYLNGEKYPMYGVCRHQDWWQVGSALTNDHHDQDLAMIMDIGATTVRLAHYQQSDYFYSRCDTLGLLVWAEIPFVNRVTGEESDNAHTQLKELIRQSYNHPSIYIWGLHNEVYHPHAYTAQLTQSLHNLAKSEDPGRLTVAVNGYGHMHHPVNLNADVQGMNRYFGWYEKKIQDIKPWIVQLEQEYPDIPFMLTEYGADANIAQQTELLGDALDWTKPYYPETFQTKTHEYQWSVIKDHPYILASYLWNMFDFAVPAWSRGGVPARNMKGLVTFDRKIKKDSYYFYKVSWSQNPVLYITQRRLTQRERQQTTVTLYSNLGTPQVTLNGTPLPAPAQGFTPIHYNIEGVTLQKGRNVIKATVEKEGKTYTDEIIWNFEQEQKGTASDYENRNEHFGF